MGDLGTHVLASSDPPSWQLVAAIRAVGRYSFLISLAPIALDGAESTSSPDDAMPTSSTGRDGQPNQSPDQRLTAPDPPDPLLLEKWPNNFPPHLL